MASIYYAILKEFKAQWEKKYFGRTFNPRPQHFKQLKELLTPVDGFDALELDEVVKRMMIYLNNPYYKVCAHSFSVFIKNFDNFVPPPPPRRAPATVACQRCGEIYRVNEQHKCGVIGDGIRKDKPAVPLNALLPRSEGV